MGDERAAHGAELSHHQGHGYWSVPALITIVVLFALGPTTVTLAVRGILGIYRLPDGRLKKRWSETIEEIPIVIAIDERPTSPDPRFTIPSGDRKSVV